MIAARNATTVFLALLVSAVVGRAAPAQSTADYQATPEVPAAARMQTLSLNPEEINVLAANLAGIDPGLKSRVLNHMFHAVYAKRPGTYRIEWRLVAPEAGRYEITALMVCAQGRIVIETNGRKSPPVSVHRKAWDRIGLGTTALKQGMNRLALNIETGSPLQLTSIELARPEVRARDLAQALAERKRPDWFRDAGYGLMFQWCNRTTPPKGDIKPWEQKVADFDLDGFMKLVEDSGASFVVWSVTWGQQYISAPIQSLDRILPGRTTKRDLLGELADRLHAKGIRLIFYYHYGYDCNHSIDSEWMEAVGGYEADKTRLFQNWMNIVGEIGQRYGEKLDGWWFDGGHRYYNTHFDGSEAVGISSAPFKAMRRAARMGNSERIICYNPWVLPRLTEHQDYFAGEAKHDDDPTEEGVFTAGSQKGLMKFGLYIFERRWGHIEKDTPIAAPKYSVDQLVAMIQEARASRSPIAFNLETYEDGSVSPASAELLKATRKRLEELAGK